LTKLLLPVCLFVATIAGAQQNALPVFCGNEALNYIVQNQYPELHQAFQSSFDENLHRHPVTDRSPVTIRVVVHVVWKNPEENLADSIILNQIDVLNEDYNRENPDTANLRPAFQTVAGNPQVRFELVEIVRVQTNTNFELDLTNNQILANLKKSSQGGSDAWDPTAYLNIWICKIQPITFGGLTIGQILGFAFPPNNLNHWPANSSAPSLDQDGVALDFRIIGRNNPNTVQIPGGTGNLTVRGRTATHEVGHYLGLRHIWGDGGILGLPNDCNQSDGMDDTPFASAQSPFDCDKNRNSCSKVETFYGMDMPDLVENYMDYSSEACMNMFTQNQAAMIQSVLAGPRNGLLQVSADNTPELADAQPQLFPNPTRGGAWLRIPANWNPRAIELFSLDGRLMQRLPAPAAGAETQLAINTQNLLPGGYAVRVQTAGQVWVERLVVLR
jgi:hypothetical protein